MVIAVGSAGTLMEGENRFLARFYGRVIKVSSVCFLYKQIRLGSDIHTVSRGVEGAVWVPGPCL